MVDADFQAHLDGGHTTLARCWQVLRRDGEIMGFTDHDCDLAFADTVFRAGSGLTALALSQAAGLSVDNTEAMGALSDAAISAVDIAAGRYDGAVVTAWLVNWADVGQRKVLFRGAIGEITREGGAFHAELRGLTEALNRPMGRAYQKPCGAVLGDGACGVDLSDPAFQYQGAVQTIEDGRILRFSDLSGFDAGWFTRGVLHVMSGDGSGQSAGLKSDTNDGGVRVIELWSPLPVVPEVGDQLQLIAGCDKRFATCVQKFANTQNFQGFPDIPGDDWIARVPRADGTANGGSLR